MRKMIGIVRVSLCTATVAGVPTVNYDFPLGGDQLLGHHLDSIDVTGAPAQIDLHIAAVVPAQLRKRPQELRFDQPVLGEPAEHANPPHKLRRPLRARRQRPRRRAAKVSQ